MAGISIRSVWKVTAIVAVTCAIIVSAFAWSAAPEQAMATPGTEASTRDVALQDDDALTNVELVEQVNPAVVTVYNLTTLENELTGELQDIPQGTGTGFIIDEEGHIVTNWHVVTGGSEYAVALSDGTTVEAELIGIDPRDDLAVVKIDPESVPATVPLGDSDALQPGQPVVAIGSPLGQFTNTVTAGIVSGLNRDGLSRSSICQNYANLIQHDAAINPGNSGGPLFNLDGEVIGVNTLGLPETPSGVSLQGLFFAVPSNLVADVAQQLIETGTIAAPYIGVSAQPLNAASAAALGLDIEGGNLVRSVPADGPAAEAGIQPNDVIVAIDGQQISPERGLPDILLDYEAGDTVDLLVLRSGASGSPEDVTVELTLGNVPEEVLEACVLQPGG